ncbi:pentatricopeptide repeat-containing protein At2g01740-like [Musa acuminata AAA Group]|uniref:pentatricopeptide repeat-containing protein At2g01740-like n=1 Tax=Musa acuminata AAA Group TaxID=214697 RepID=UPI0031CDB22F
MGYFTLNDMQFLGISPNLVTFTCLIDGYCKNDRLDMALDLYDRMTSLSVLPNVFTFNALVDALCKKGMLERAVEMFEKMHEIGVPANVVVYTSLIDGDVKKGLDLHNEMLIKGFELDLSTTSAGFASMGFCRRQKDGQCPEYSADEQAICAVGLAKSKSGIFVEAILYLLVLATPVEGDDAGAEGAMGINKTEEVVEEVVDLGKLTMKGPGRGEGEGDRQWQR